MNLGTASVIRANSRALPLADNTVDLVVTSPPYFALRSYQDGGEHYAGQVGDEPTPAEFVASLLEVTRECVRVLKPSGSIFVNLGDKYVADNRGSGFDVKRGEAKHAPRGSLGYITGGMRQKSLMGIPWRYALACIDDLGLILRAEVIWSKPNGLPESVTDRVRRSHEQWFHFTLEPRYFSAVDEIREAHAAGAFHVSGKGQGQRIGMAAMSGQTLNDDQARHPLGKLPGSVWIIPTEPLRVPDQLGIDHFAAFPSEFPRRIIAGWSPAGVCVACGEGRRPVTERQSSGRGRSTTAASDPSWQAINRADWQENVTRLITGYACACMAYHGGYVCTDLGTCSEPDCYGRDLPDTRPAVVLDPFGGTGTTAMVAKALGRHGITVDMSADYCRLAAWRTGDEGQVERVQNMQRYGTRRPTKRQIREHGATEVPTPPVARLQQVAPPPVVDRRTPMTEYVDVPMFDVEPGRVVTPKRPRVSGRPKWSRLKRVSPVKCDDCSLVLALAPGRGCRPACPDSALPPGRTRPD